MFAAVSLSGDEGGLKDISYTCSFHYQDDDYLPLGNRAIEQEDETRSNEPQGVPNQITSP